MRSASPVPDTALPDYEVIERRDETVDVDGPWVVILYNCDCHSFDDVIMQLQKATGCSLEKAFQIALEAHTRDRAIAYTGAAEKCEHVASILRAIKLQVETDRF